MGTFALPQALKKALVLSHRSSSIRGHSFRSFFRSVNSLNEATNAAASKSEEDFSKNTSSSTNSGSKLDPFGIEDIDTVSSSVLVQGFYQQDWTKPPKKVAKIQDQELEVKQQRADRSSGGGIHDEQSSRLQTYDRWLKSREEALAKELVEEMGEGPPERYRETSYGNFRLDSDNVVDEDGQYDERHSIPRSRSRGQSSYKQWNKVNEETNEDSSSGMMTAHDFLKKFKDEKSQEMRSSRHPEQQNQAQSIDKPVRPRPSKQEEVFDRFASRIVNPSSLDSNVIPKVYQMLNYNSFTQQDMWNVLKKSVIYQNEFILAINKPFGIPIHSAAVDCRHHITQFLDRFSDIGNCKEVFPLHRLDKETSGVLLFAKDQKIAKFIIEKFSVRQIDKTYLAITKGCPKVPSGTIKIPIGEGRVGGTEKFRSVLKPDLRKYEIKTRQGNCREAITHFNVLNSTRNAAFVEIKPETGLKHQIRLHMGLGLGCPIIGDHKYSHRDRMAPQRLHPELLHRIKVKQSKVREIPLHLHCSSISFTLPEADDPVYIHALVPYYFKHTLRVFGLK